MEIVQQQVNQDDGRHNPHQAAIRLASAGIIANGNCIPYDPRPPGEWSGIRLGTPSLTSRGMQPEQMRLIAGWIDEFLTGDGDKAMIKKTRRKVRELCRAFPVRLNAGRRVKTPQVIP